MTYNPFKYWFKRTINHWKQRCVAGIMIFLGLFIGTWLQVDTSGPNETYIVAAYAGFFVLGFTCFSAVIRFGIAITVCGLCRIDPRFIDLYYEEVNHDS